MEETKQWTTAPDFSPQENFDMLRETHTEGGSEAEYLLETYNMMYQGHGDTGDVDATSGANHTLSSANSPRSAPDAVDEPTQTTASPSSSQGSSRDSLFDTEESDEEGSCSDPIIPVDYSEDRKNDWRRAGYHDHRLDPWASEWGKHQRPVPQARQPAEDAAWREAYRELTGENPPAPVPPPEPRFLATARCPENPDYFCDFLAVGPGQLLHPDQEGRLWYPKWEHRCRPYQHPRPKPQSEEPTKWARIPCDCWHCATHRSPKKSQVRVYQLDQIFSKHRYSTC